MVRGQYMGASLGKFRALRIIAVDPARPRAGLLRQSVPMSAPDRIDANPTLSAAAIRSGYAGVIPFVVCLLGVLLAPGIEWRARAQQAAIDYGAVILSFVGALHWGLALGGKLRGDGRTIFASVLPSMVAALALGLVGQRALALLVIGFGLFWLYEHHQLRDRLPADYLRMRRNLTLAVCGTLALTMFASESVGLP